jgi:sulfonate transport system substrate-binding protein
LGRNAIDISWGLSDTAAPKASAEDRTNWTAANAPIKLIALLVPLHQTGDTPGLVIANAKSGIHTVADLRGKS